MHGTTAGLSGPKRSDVSISENSDGYCSYCGDHADGIDSIRRTAVCQRCARILSEWGRCKNCKKTITPQSPNGLPFYDRLVHSYFAHFLSAHVDRSEWGPQEEQ